MKTCMDLFEKIMEEIGRMDDQELEDLQEYISSRSSGEDQGTRKPEGATAKNPAAIAAQIYAGRNLVTCRGGAQDLSWDEMEYLHKVYTRKNGAPVRQGAGPTDPAHLAGASYYLGFFKGYSAGNKADR